MAMEHLDIEQYRVKPQQQVSLADYPTHPLIETVKEHNLQEKLQSNIEQLKDLQQKLMAEETRSIIVVLQALDAAGKDEAERYLFSNLSPQALRTTSFAKPSEEEKKHDYLWRLHDAMPERGVIGVFNRSHYEELIAARVYDSLQDYPLPEEIKQDPNLWEKRFKHVNNYEEYLGDNGFYMLKIYLHISKSVQKERLIERLEDPDRNWEFSFSDLEDRENWNRQMEVFEDTFQHTSTEAAPWYIVPADDGDYGRLVISEIILQKLLEMDPKFPQVTEEEKRKLQQAIDDLNSGKYD